MMIRTRAQQHRQQYSAGFTLIELVVVITILAILSAAALPRFVSLQQDARIAKLDGISGALRSAAALAHAACLSQSGTGSIAAGATCAADGSVSTVPTLMEGADISLRNQYPAASNIGIDRAANIDVLRDKLIAANFPPAVAGGPNTRQFQIESASDPTKCAASYTEAMSTGGKITTTATVDVISSGC
jgi:MSHA pilin protein MshA